MRETIKQTLVDHGVSDISGALLDELAALTQSPTCCEATRDTFVAGYRAAHFDPTAYDIEAAAIEAWDDHIATAALTPLGHRVRAQQEQTP